MVVGSLASNTSVAVSQPLRLIYPSRRVAGGYSGPPPLPKVSILRFPLYRTYPSRFLTISSALSNRLRNCLSGSAPFGSFVPRTPPPGLTPRRPHVVRAPSKLSPQTITTPRSFPSSGSTKDNHQKPGSAFFDPSKSDTDAARDLDCSFICYTIGSIAYSHTRPLAKAIRLLSVSDFRVWPSAGFGLAEPHLRAGSPCTNN